ncbi:hypothetical protein QYE76_000133 [Lolium multiflorum]|uniref:Uncharacterized protein n=1 Tax=Lolium multiflorum TaxID=4521 RepID=A0AAD8VY32_LOLMU|nr:hypothetical protein QYE76_000133 [Lolium multiflorum]
MTSAVTLPSSAAAASLPVASSTSTTPAMASSSTTATVSPFLAALLAGTAPPPLVPPSISTRPAGSLFTNGAGWPFSTPVSPLARATSAMVPPPPTPISGSPAVVPSACPTPAPAPPAPISGVLDAPGATAFQPPPPVGSAPMVPYGAGLYGQPLFYGMPPLSYGPHSSPPSTAPVLDTATTAAPTVVPTAGSAAAAGHAAPAAPFHFAHLLMVKLNADNYLLWRAQVLPLLRSHYLEGFVDGSLPCPPAVLQVTTADGAPMVIPNPAHRLWVAQDQAILGAIQSSLTPSVAGMNKVKEMADILSSIGQPLRDEEFTSFVLNGLDEDYEALVENINGRDTPLPPRELYARLLNTEQRRLKMRPDGSSADAVANAAYRGGGRGQQQPRPQGGPPPQPRQPATTPRPNSTTGGRGRAWQCPACGAKVPCQLCGIEGHLASRCHRRFKQDFLGIGNDGRGNEKQAALATQGSTSSYPVDPTWYMHTGATDHLTHDLSHLTARESYTGHDQVLDEVRALSFWMILLRILPPSLFTSITRCPACPMQPLRSPCRCSLRFHVGAGIPGVAPHHISPQSTFNVLLGSSWFDKPWFLSRKTCHCAHHTFLLGFPTDVYIYAHHAACLAVASTVCASVTCACVARFFGTCDNGSSIDCACTCALSTTYT